MRVVRKFGRNESGTKETEQEKSRFCFFWGENFVHCSMSWKNGKKNGAIEWKGRRLKQKAYIVLRLDRNGWK